LQNEHAEQIKTITGDLEAKLVKAEKDSEKALKLLGETHQVELKK